MIDTFVCAAPAGIDGSGRVRVPVLPSASLLTSDAGATGGAMRTGTRGIEQPAVLAPRGAQPFGASTQPFGTSTKPFGTTNAYTTLGIHSPGRPQS
jgi:hypothetical protein